jgi:hypothetical protein
VAAAGPAGTVRALAQAMAAATSEPPPPPLAFDLDSQQQRLAELLQRVGLVAAVPRAP